MIDVETQTPLQRAVSLLNYRRELLADAKKERANMQRLVRRCEKAVQEAADGLFAQLDSRP